MIQKLIEAKEKALAELRRLAEEAEAVAAAPVPSCASTGLAH